jgi:hypothetical protein
VKQAAIFLLDDLFIFPEYADYASLPILQRIFQSNRPPRSIIRNSFIQNMKDVQVVPTQALNLHAESQRYTGISRISSFTLK